MFSSTGAAGAFLSSQLLCASVSIRHPDKSLSPRHPDAAEPGGALPVASAPLLGEARLLESISTYTDG